MLFFVQTINIFHSAPLLLNASSSSMRALLCSYLWECCGILRAEGWDGLCLPWLSRGNAAGSLQLLWDLAQHWVQASFHITAPSMIGQDIWTKGLASNIGPGIPGMPASCCSPSWPFPHLCSTCPQQVHTYTHCALWPGTNRWAFLDTVNPHTGTFQFWSNLFFFWCYLFLPDTISLR